MASTRLFAKNDPENIPLLNSVFSNLTAERKEVYIATLLNMNEYEQFTFLQKHSKQTQAIHQHISSTAALASTCKNPSKIIQLQFSFYRLQFLNSLSTDPITLEKMQSPTITPDGYTYDRSSLDKVKKDPYTQRLFSPKSLRPNQLVIDLITLLSSEEFSWLAFYQKLMCPITKEILKNPVVDAKGNTYEAKFHCSTEPHYQNRIISDLLNSNECKATLDSIPVWKIAPALTDELANAINKFITEYLGPRLEKDDSYHPWLRKVFGKFDFSMEEKILAATAFLNALKQQPKPNIDKLKREHPSLNQGELGVAVEKTCARIKVR